MAFREQFGTTVGDTFLSDYPVHATLRVNWHDGIGVESLVEVIARRAYGVHGRLAIDIKSIQSHVQARRELLENVLLPRIIGFRAIRIPLQVQRHGTLDYHGDRLNDQVTRIGRNANDNMANDAEEN
jgi:hypothetical protein